MEAFKEHSISIVGIMAVGTQWHWLSAQGWRGRGRQDKPLTSPLFSKLLLVTFGIWLQSAMPPNLLRCHVATLLCLALLYVNREVTWVGWMCGWHWSCLEKEGGKDECKSSYLEWESGYPSFSSLQLPLKILVKKISVKNLPTLFLTSCGDKELTTLPSNPYWLLFYKEVIH
jgi:hypothetical protein